MYDLSERRLYLCTPIRPDLGGFLAACVAGGVDVVQLRDKDRDAVDVIAAGREAAMVCADLGVPFLMNDRPDLALEVGADGVHVGQDDAPVSLCRRILGPDALIGLSTHASDELGAALETDATYISAGPVVPTPTKPGRAGTGVGYAAEAIAAATVPVFVTGGVSPESIPGLAAAGVSHFVVVRGLTEAADPRRAAAALRAAIDEGLELR
jgi:thiamine-phosphate pyrophosphorylase